MFFVFFSEVENGPGLIMTGPGAADFLRPLQTSDLCDDTEVGIKAENATNTVAIEV